MLAGRGALAAAPLQLCQTEVAVGLEWAHAKLLRQGSRPEVMVFARIGLGRFTECADLAEHPERSCLHCPLLPRPAELERPRCGSLGLLEAVTDRKRLGKPHIAEALIDAKPEAFDVG